MDAILPLVQVRAAEVDGSLTPFAAIEDAIVTSSLLRASGANIALDDSERDIGLPPAIGVVSSRYIATAESARAMLNEANLEELAQTRIAARRFFARVLHAGYSESLERAVTESVARVYVELSDPVADWLGVRRPWRALRSTVESIDVRDRGARTEMLERAYSDEIDTESVPDVTLSRSLAKRPVQGQRDVRAQQQARLARDLDVLERALRNSNCLRFFGDDGGLDAVAQALSRAELLYGLTDADFLVEHGRRQDSDWHYELQGIGERTWNRTSELASYPDTPVVLRRSGDRLEVVRVGYARTRLMVLQDQRGKFGSVWRAVDLGLELPNARWRLRDSVDPGVLPRVEVDGFGAMALRRETLREFLRRAGLPAGISVVDAEVRQRDGAWVVGVSIDAEGIVARGASTINISLGPELLADPLALRSRLVSAIHSRVRNELNSLRLPAKAGECFTFLPQWFDDWTVEAAWIKTDPTLALTLWMRDEEQRGFRVVVEAAVGGFRIANLVGDRPLLMHEGADRIDALVGDAYEVDALTEALQLETHRREQILDAAERIAPDVAEALSGRMSMIGLTQLAPDEIEAVIATSLLDASLGDVESGADTIAARVGEAIASRCAVVWATEESSAVAELMTLELARVFADSPGSTERDLFASVREPHQRVVSAVARVLDAVIGEQEVQASWLIAGADLAAIRAAAIERVLAEHLRSNWFRVPGSKSTDFADEGRLVNSARAAWTSEISAVINPETARVSWGTEPGAGDTTEAQGVEAYFARFRSGERPEEAVLVLARDALGELDAFRGQPIDLAADALLDSVARNVTEPAWLRQAIVEPGGNAAAIRLEIRSFLSSMILEALADGAGHSEDEWAIDSSRVDYSAVRERIELASLRWLRTGLAASAMTTGLSSERSLHLWLGETARDAVRPLVEPDLIVSLRRTPSRQYAPSSISGVFESRADPRVKLGADGRVRVKFVGDVKLLSAALASDVEAGEGHVWSEHPFVIEMNGITRRAVEAASRLHESRSSGDTVPLSDAINDATEAGVLLLGLADEAFQAAAISQVGNALRERRVVSSRTQAVRSQLVGAIVDGLSDEMSQSISLSLDDIDACIDFAQSGREAVSLFTDRVRDGVQLDESAELAGQNLESAMAAVLVAESVDDLRTRVVEFQSALLNFQEEIGIEASQGLPDLGKSAAVLAVRSALDERGATTLYRRLGNGAALEFARVERMYDFILRIENEDLEQFSASLDEINALIREPTLMTPGGRLARKAIVAKLRDMRTGLGVVLPGTARELDNLLAAIEEQTGTGDLMALWDAVRSRVEQDVADVKRVFAEVQDSHISIENLLQSKPSQVPRNLRAVASALRPHEARLAPGLGFTDRLDVLADRVDGVNTIIDDVGEAVDSERDRIEAEVAGLMSAYEEQFDDIQARMRAFARSATVLRGKVSTPTRWGELVDEEDGMKRVREIEEMRKQYAELLEQYAKLLELEELELRLMSVLTMDLNDSLESLEELCIQMDELHARVEQAAREVDSAIANASAELDALLSQVTTIQRQWRVVGGGVTQIYDKIDEFLTDPDLRESPEVLSGVAEQLDLLGAELGLKRSGAAELRTLAAALSDGQALFDNTRAFTEAVSDLPQSVAADLAVAVKQPQVEFGWDPTRGVTFATSFDALGDGATARALKNPVLRDSAIGQWSSGVFSDSELQRITQDVGEKIDAYSSQMLAEARGFADPLIDSADRTIEELFAKLPREIPFIGTTVQVSYGEGENPLAVTLLHVPEPGSLVPEFEITGLFEVAFTADLERGPELKVSDRFSGRVGSLRAPLESILSEILPGGLTLRGDPEVRNGRVLVRFRYQPSAFPFPVLGEVDIPLDLTDVTVDIGITEFRDAMIGLLVDELVVELNEMIGEDGVPGVGPLTLSDRGDAIQPLKQVTGEFGFIVNAKLEISDILDLPVVLHLGIESGLELKVDPNVLASALGPLFDSVFGSDAMFRIVPDTPLYTTGDRLRIHLLYEMDVPVLDVGLGGGMVLSSDGVDLGDGVTLKIPGWLEAPPLAFGNLRLTLQPSNRKLALGCSITLTPGPASVNLVDARITGSMTYSEPVTIGAEGRLIVFRLITLGDARVLVTPKYGSLEATVGSSPLIGDFFKLEGLLQIEASKSRSRLLRNKHWNILYTTDTEVLGLVSQTVEGGLTWDGEGLLSIEQAFPFARGTGEVTFSDGFADPKLEFRGRIGEAGGIANITIDVIADSRGVLVSAQASVKGVPLGVTFVLTDLGSLTPGRIADELLDFFDLSLSLDPAFSITNVPDSDLSGETGARDVPEKGIPGTPPVIPTSPDVTVGNLVWKRCVETERVVIGYETSGGWIPILRKDRPIYGTSYKFVSGAKRLNLPNAEAAWNQGAYFALEPDRGHHLVTYADGRFDVYGGRPLKKIWSGRTDRRAPDAAPQFAMLPLMRSASGALVATGYGTSSDTALTIAAMPGVLIPSVTDRFRDIEGRQVDLTRARVGGATIGQLVADGLDSQEEQTISVMVTLILAGARFDDFLVMGRRAETGPVVLLERQARNTRKRWIYTGLDDGSQMVARVDEQESFTTEFLESWYDGIGRALVRYRDDADLGTSDDLGFIREVAFLTFGGDDALQDPFIAMIGKPRPRGSSGGVPATVWLGRADGARHAFEMHAEDALGAHDLAAHFTFSTDDPVSRQLQTILGDPTTDLAEPMQIVAAMGSGESGALRRAALLYKTTAGKRMFALCDDETRRLQSPVLRSFDDVAEYWSANRSAAPVGLALELEARSFELLRRLALDDWEAKTDWRADPAGAFW